LEPITYHQSTNVVKSCCVYTATPLFSQVSQGKEHRALKKTSRVRAFRVFSSALASQQQPSHIDWLEEQLLGSKFCSARPHATIISLQAANPKGCFSNKSTLDGTFARTNAAFLEPASIGSVALCKTIRLLLAWRRRL